MSETTSQAPESPAAPPRSLMGDRVNPVLARELTERMRRRNTPVMLSVFLLLMTGIFALLFSAVTRFSAPIRCVGGECFTDFGVIGFAGAGRTLFRFLLFFLVLLACFIVPAVTSGTIAGERERQTLVPLQLTLLTPLRVVVGKLSAALAFMVFLFVAVLPLMAVTFLIGGVPLWDVVLVAPMIVLACVTMGSLAIMCSALVRRSQAATVAAYGLVFVLTIGTFVPTVVVGVMTLSNGNRPATNAFLAPNPFFAAASVLSVTDEFMVSDPLSGARTMMESARVRPDLTRPERTLARIPPWILSVLSLVMLTAASLAIASWGLRTPAPNP